MNPKATTPPMGWNSWNCYGTTVTEAEVLANAEYLARELLPLGWDTIVVDIQWYEPTAKAGGYNNDAPVVLDAWGRQLPAENRFPSAAGGAGFGPLAAAVHALGLRFGLHIMRGIPRVAVEQRLPVHGAAGITAADIADTSSICAWNPDNFGLDHDHPGAQLYYDAQVAQFARWGVDFIKADDMLAPYYAAEIEAYSRAIDRSGRDIELSLSPGTALSLAHQPHLARNASAWRVSDDLWDRWDDVLAQFGRMARWAPFQREGAWADADMLPLGRIGVRAERGTDRLSLLTADEQRTLMTLWCISRSPLMFGGDLPSTPAETLALLNNPDVLAMHRASSGQRELMREDDVVLWSSRATDRSADYVAVFNTGQSACEVRIAVSALGLSAGRHPHDPVLDLWTTADVHCSGDYLESVLPAHGAVLLRFDRADDGAGRAVR